VKAILLAGGLGTRLREETEFRPKPMVEVGGRPILWHIMKNLAHFGITDFIVATGYKSDVIKDYFLNYEAWSNDFTIELGNRDSLTFHGGHDEAGWRVTVAYTGDLTMTGGRVHRAARYLDDEPFLVTYGDGLSDVDITALRSFHEAEKTIGTVTTVQPMSRFGVMDVSADGKVMAFREKPRLDGWVNTGFFMFKPEFIDYLDDNCTLELEPLARLVAERELSAYRHDGYWQPVDTYRELTMLNQMWDEGDFPWRRW
jgi:glucose-1-phosphate cytidylyltransferase